MHLLIHDYAGHPFEAQLSRELAQRGHQVTHAYAGNLLTPRGALQLKPDDAPTLDFVEVPMAEAYRANKYSFLKRRGYELAYGTELASLVTRLQPDLVISGNTPSEPQWTMIQAARRLKLPVISWVQDFYSVAVDKLARKKLPVIGALAGAWYRHMDGNCFRASAAIIAITEDFLPILDGFGVPPGRVTVIPNWAPLDELPVLPRVNAWSARQGLNDKFVFHYSGTLAMKHNPDLLRQLAARFREDAAIRVVVISEGPGADYLKKVKVRDHLENLLILPFQPFADLPEILAAADVLLAVLEADAGVFSVPSKVLSYHCAGRPILAAMPARNLASRILKQAGSGYCVEPDDSAGFIEQAASLRNDSWQRDQCGQAARVYAETRFAIGTIASRFETLFNKVISTARITKPRRWLPGNLLPLNQPAAGCPAGQPADFVRAKISNK